MGQGGHALGKMAHIKKDELTTRLIVTKVGICFR